MARVKCPNAECGKVSVLADELLGRKVRCRACSTVFQAETIVDASSAGTKGTTADTSVGASVAGLKEGSSIVTVIARRTDVAPSSPPISEVKPQGHMGRAGAWKMAAAALLTPVLLAGSFLVWKTVLAPAFAERWTVGGNW